MTDQIEHDIRRGDQAEALLRNELLTESFAALEAQYIEAWRNTPARDTDGRERLWQAVQIVGLVKSRLLSIANSGKLAKLDLDHIVTMAERKS